MTELLNTRAIAVMLKLSRGHVTNRLVKTPGFPRPKVQVSRKTRLWDRAEVLAWCHRRRPAIDSADSL